MTIGTTEVLIIIIAAGILLFGGKKIGEFARALGRAIGEFRKGQLEVEKEIEELKLKKKHEKK
jgi:sec-independent protein translocase protein TatA